MKTYFFFIRPYFMVSTILSVVFFSEKGLAQTLDSELNEVESPQKGIDNVWRSSDLEGEQAVLRQQRKAKRVDGSALLPEGSERVGCVCMDYFVQEHIGRGACGGHNGVRFWLYQLPSGDTVQIPTLRHEAHPDTLSDATLFQLAAYKRFERLMTQKQLDFYATLEEYPEWLNPAQRVQPDAFAPESSAFRHLYPATPTPSDGTATDTLIYSLSVLIGSGALAVLKKIFATRDTPPELPLPPPSEPETLI